MFKIPPVRTGILWIGAITTSFGGIVHNYDAITVGLALVFAIGFSYLVSCS